MSDYDLFIQHYNEDKSYDELNKEFGIGDSKARIVNYMRLIRAIHVIEKKILEAMSIEKKDDYKTPEKYIFDDRITHVDAEPLEGIDESAVIMYILSKNPNYHLNTAEIGKLFNISRAKCSSLIADIDMARKHEDIRANLINARDKINKMIKDGEIKLFEYSSFKYITYAEDVEEFLKEINKGE